MLPAAKPTPPQLQPGSISAENNNSDFTQPVPDPRTRKKHPHPPPHQIPQEIKIPSSPILNEPPRSQLPYPYRRRKLALFVQISFGPPPIRTRKKITPTLRPRFRAGDMAPDFDLKVMHKEARVALSSFRNKLPVALIFGS